MKGQTILLTGMILSAGPIGEYDKRVILLTKEKGKINAFAKGARRQNSQLLAATNPFSFGTFEVYEGRNSYTIVKSDISNYFQKLTQNLEGTYFGFYFLEIADYFTQENNDEIHMLKLLYQTLRAIENENIDNNLIRYIFELKTMVINGEYPNVFTCQNCNSESDIIGFHTKSGGVLCKQCVNKKEIIPINNSLLYTMQYIVSSTIEKLYTFTVSFDILTMLEMIMKEYLNIYLPKKFNSLKVLEENIGFANIAVEIRNQKRYNI